MTMPAAVPIAVPVTATVAIPVSVVVMNIDFSHSLSSLRAVSTLVGSPREPFNELELNAPALLQSGMHLCRKVRQNPVHKSDPLRR